LLIGRCLFAGRSGCWRRQGDPMVVDSATDGGRVSYGSKVVTRVAVHTTCFRTTPLFGPND